MNWNTRREPAIGVMLHYTAGSYAGSVSWCRDPRAGVSYHYIVSNEGKVTLVAPLENRAWHAGVCRPSHPKLAYRDANSAFYGVAVALSAGMQASDLAYRTIAGLCVGLFFHHGWELTDGWRITGHGDEAWPRGRKVDPVGPDPAHPVLDPDRVRQEMLAGRWL